MSISDAVRKASLAALFLTLAATSCGLADDERSEKNKYVYLTFFDKTFERFCLENYDLNGDGRLSRYEAQRVREISCAGFGIASLADLEAFTSLEELDCARNGLAELDLAACTRLKRLDCSGNRIARLDVEDLRALVRLNCSENELAQIDLTSNSSLTELDVRRNRLQTLDVASCAATLRADVRENPELTTVYCRPAVQNILFDGITELVGR